MKNVCRMAVVMCDSKVTKKKQKRATDVRGRKRASERKEGG